MSATELSLISAADWTALKNLALHALPAQASRRVYSAALDHFSLGHSSLTTTERYLGLEQDLSSAPGDCIRLNIEPKPASAGADKRAERMTGAASY